jgi:hypothetical protein
MAGCQLPAPAEQEPSRRPSGRISAPADGEGPEDPAERETETPPGGGLLALCGEGGEKGKRGEGGRYAFRPVDGRIGAVGEWYLWSISAPASLACLFLQRNPQMAMAPKRGRRGGEGAEGGGGEQQQRRSGRQE